MTRRPHDSNAHQSDSLHALGAQLAARERQLATLIEHNPTGILLLDREGHVVLQNRVVATLTGAREGRGRSVGEVLHLQDEQGHPVPLALPQASEPVTVRGYWSGHNGERPRYLQVSIAPVHHAADGASPQTEAYIVNLVDLTALREAESAKHVFLAGLSHELKTPLALIRGYAENLRFPQVRAGDAMVEEALDVILDETTHLTEMVDHLLLAARLQAGALALERHDVAVGRMLERLVEEYAEVHPQHRWTLSIASDLPVIQGDPNRLRAVFHNLLSNAQKYSNPGSTIEVHATPHARGLRVTVRDEGIGIDATDQSRLFERFFRASDRADGTGLGLYMSKAIVEAHGGRIHVDSVSGEGSTFIVDLPTSTRRSQDSQ